MRDFAGEFLGDRIYGRPYLLDVLIARTGLAADSTWHPRYSLAAARTKKV
jgi:hypothetical protein